MVWAFLIIGFGVGGARLSPMVQALFLPVLFFVEMLTLLSVFAPEVIVAPLNNPRIKEVATIAGRLPAYGLLFYAIVVYWTGRVW